jgi:hypothetical protein
MKTFAKMGKKLPVCKLNYNCLEYVKSVIGTNHVYLYSACDYWFNLEYILYISKYPVLLPPPSFYLLVLSATFRRDFAQLRGLTEKGGHRKLGTNEAKG